MHSVNSEKTGSLRKRTLSRGMSEDESLRHIIREVEETNRCLSRSDSRYGSLNRGQRVESVGEEDLTEKTEMVELRADYELCLQEVRALELHQEALLFQVDCLQDALEGAEEMLSEAKRESHAVKVELDHEREVRRKLENMITTLMQEINVLKEEQKSVSVVPVTRLVEDQTQVVRDVDDSTVFSGTSVDGDTSNEGMSIALSSTVSQSTISAQQPASSKGGLASFFKTEQYQSKQAEPVWLQGAPRGTSVDQEAAPVSDTESSRMDLNTNPMLQLKNTLYQMVLSNQKREAQDGDDNDESSGYEDAPSEFSPSPLTPDMSPDRGVMEDDTDAGGSESGDPKNPESCILS